MVEAIGISNLSRYKDTPLFDDALFGKDEIQFGTMVPPEEFLEPSENVRRHTVAASEVGFLDILAVRFYGQGYEELWWSIALANAILDPENDMFVGQTLLIPPRAQAIKFISRVGEG